VPGKIPLYWKTIPGLSLMSSGPFTSVNDPSPFIVAMRTGMPSTGEPVAVAYVMYMTHCFALDDCVTTQEPVMPSLLCSESVPSPMVVVAAAVVVASEGSTPLDALPARKPPTIGPPIDYRVEGTVIVELVAVVVVSTVDVLDEAPVRATARWTLSAIAATVSTTTMLTTANAIRLVFIGGNCYL
jgi:hypothetical protein